MRTVIFYKSLFYFFLYMNNFKSAPLLMSASLYPWSFRVLTNIWPQLEVIADRGYNMGKRSWWRMGKTLLFRDQWILVFILFCFYKSTLSFSACSHSHSANDFLNGNSKALLHECSRANAGPVGRSQLQGKQTTFCRASWKS